MMKADTKYAVYEEYKESGIAWLGRVPTHWQVSLLKWRYQVTLGKMLKSKQTAPDETEAPYLRAANIQWRGVDTSDVKRMWFTPEEKKKLQLCKGDLLVSEGGDVGRSALWNEEIDGCYIQNSINRIRARENADTRFLYYWMYFIKHAGYIDMICNKATIAHFTVEKIGATPCVYPPLEEQNQIAVFLDKETAKMDALVEKQEHLITLLREKRQAIISHAVTKGLNPNAKMKESGIEWLGEVPEHWKITKLGYIAKKIGSGKTPRGGSEVYQKEGILFLRSQNVHDRGLMLGKKEAVYISVEIDSEMSATRVKPGDILLNITGASIGRTCIVPANFPRANVNQHVCIIRVPENLQYYLSYFLKSVFSKSQIDAFQTGASREGLNFEQISKIILCIPPKREQQKIATFLDKETTKIDTLVEKCETAIELLKERRIALIAAAVTGKIDVRRAT